LSSAVSMTVMARFDYSLGLRVANRCFVAAAP